MGKVYYRKTEDRKPFIKDVLEILTSELTLTKNIIVNVDLSSNEPYPTTTHPEVLSEVLSFFRDRSLLVVGGPSIDSVIRNKIPNSHPLKLITRKFGLDLMNLNLMKLRKIKVRKINLRLVDMCYDDSCVVSIPVLKAHKVCKLSCVLENQLGFLSVKDKFMLYTKIKDIHKTIAEVNLFIKPVISIVDAVEVMIGANERRHGGRVGFLGYMIAGIDPVSVDSFCLKLMKEVDSNLTNVRPKDIKYLRLAEELGVGSTKYSAVEV
ncbi:MAG TPA: DUF362 domain-containing protein [Candidatus Korarchaeota archaeon]|nr:DUF362 domain-containing protein [Candidatus Korarchaeota archaeon]